MLVNPVGVAVTDAKGVERRRSPDKATCGSAFATSLPITPETIAEVVACARARRKVEPRGSPGTENESLNALKSNGRHLEHSFGHGKQRPAMMFAAMMLAAMNLLAPAIRTACDCLEQGWIDARAAKRARTRFFEHVGTITAYLVFPDWATLMQTLIDSRPPPGIAAQVAK